MSDITREDFFSRIGATHDLASELAAEFDTVAAFLDASFDEKLRAVVGARQADAIVAEYGTFETLRDRATHYTLAELDGVGQQSAVRVDYAYIRRTVTVPRDILSAREVAQKMGFVTDRPAAPQADLGDWNAVRTDGGRP